MHRASLLLLALTAACGADAGSESVDRRIVVTGNDMGPQVQNITLSRGHGALTNAFVTVNDILMTETSAGHYSGQLPAFLAVADTIRIRVVAGVDTVVGTALVPAVPTMLAPRGGTVIHIPVPLDFSWIDVSDPDAFRAAIQFDGMTESAGFLGNARSGMVVTSRISIAATNLSAYLYAYNDGTFTGPAHPESRMHVRQSGGVVGLVMGK